MIKYLTIYVLCGSALSSCKGRFKYNFCVPIQSDSSYSIDGDVVLVADSIVSYLSGQVLDRDMNGPISFAYIEAINKETKLYYRTMSNENGEFVLKLDSDSVDVEVRAFGYNQLNYSVFLRAGEIRKVKFLLGKGAGFKNIQIRSKTKLSLTELDDLEEVLKKSD